MAATFSNTKLNTYLLPEYLCVQTKLISRTAAMTLELKSNESMHFLDDRNTQVASTVSLNEVRVTRANTSDAPSSAIQLCTTGTVTDSPKPKRDRAQQTDPIKKKINTIGTQCDMDLEWICMTPEPDNPIECQEATPPKEQEFSELLKTKTLPYSNGRIECLLCGEMARSAKAMQLHMATHWQRLQLCPRCGCLSMFRRHSCIKSQMAKIYKCPHYVCGVTTISKLELYDHINEHEGIRNYKCASCTRRFTTAIELRQHSLAKHKSQAVISRRLLYGLQDRSQRLLRVRVFPIYSMKKKFVLVKSFLSLRMRNHWQTRRLCCQICCNRFNHKRQFDKHRSRCVRVFQERMQSKRWQSSTV